MDSIFLLGIFLLPFENLKIAPSAGWATITPIIWVAYVMFNIKFVIKVLFDYKKIVVFLFIGVLLSLFNYLKVGVENINVLNSFISIGLGIVSLLSFDIYFIEKKNSYKNVIKILLFSYSISLLVGLIQYLAIKGNISFVKSFFVAIEKRSYIEYNRVQFTFTEPSFIGMHLFGILLPFYFQTKDKRLLKLIVWYSIAAVFFSSGVRIILDIFVISFIVIIAKNIHNIKILAIILITIPVFAFGFKYMYNSNYRIKEITDKGIYADGSLASRYFRINSSIKGYKKNLFNAIFGYGIGNSIIPIRAGYFEAFAEYKSTYIKEVIELGDSNYVNDSVSYCLYIRIISEFGFILFTMFIYYLVHLNKYVKKGDTFKLYLWILIYIYIQFESYAFYSLWLYIVMCKKLKDKDRMENNYAGEKEKYIS